MPGKQDGRAAFKDIESELLGIQVFLRENLYNDGGAKRKQMNEMAFDGLNLIGYIE